MTNGDPPTTARELRDWFRELKTASGLSYADIAAAIGEEERNVKRWMTVSGDLVIPRGDVVLKLLSTLGVTFNPPAPESVRSLNAAIADMNKLLSVVDDLIVAAKEADAADDAAGRSPTDARLRSLETKVDGMALATAQSLETLATAIDGLSARLSGEEPGSPRRKRAT